MVSKGLSLWRETFRNSTFLIATRFVRKMNGGAQSLLVECADGQHAVVKIFGNPQGPNVLANEFIGAVVSGAAGLPVAQVTPIYLSDEFIDRNPGLWFETTDGRHRPEAGLHCGSLFVGELEGRQRPTDYISRSKIPSIRNRNAFLGMYILDVWANHQDSRQALLIAVEDGGYEIRFIDHGHMFGGPHWRFSNRQPGVGHHLELSLYSDLWHPGSVESWISHFRTILPDCLSQVISLLPSQWYKGEISLVHDELTSRLLNLASLVERDRAGFDR